jgi:hypothetical protein
MEHLLRRPGGREGMSEQQFLHPVSLRRAVLPHWQFHSTSLDREENFGKRPINEHWPSGYLPSKYDNATAVKASRMIPSCQRRN